MEEGNSRKENQARILSQLRAMREQLEKLEERVDTLSEKEVKPETRLLTFIQGFDEMIEGGIPGGHVVMLAGPSGSMKTSLALYIMQKNRAQGVKGIYITLEESRQSLLKTMERLGIGTDEDSIVDIGKLRMEHESAEETRDWLQILKDYLSRRLEKGKLDLVIVDPLNSLYALAAMKDPRKDLFHFFAFLRGIGVTSLLISEAEQKDELFLNHEDYLADGVLAVGYSTEDGMDSGLQLRCSKMRHSNHSRTPMRLIFEKGEFSVSAKAQAKSDTDHRE